MLYEGKALNANIVSISYSKFLFFCMGCHFSFKWKTENQSFLPFYQISLLLWIQYKETCDSLV